MTINQKPLSIEINQEQMKKWNVLFAIPCYDRQISEPTMMSLIKTVMYFRDHGIKFAVATITDSLINRARNNMAAKFLAQNQLTHMMFIDADIAFQPEDIIKLLWHDQEIITAAYPIKSINWEAVKENVNNGIEPKKLLENSVRFVVNPIRKKEDNKLSIINGALEIFDAGTGFMLIKREAFAKLIEKYPHLKYNDDTGSLNEEERKLTYAFFNSYIDPHLNRFLSEDYGFCRYWQDIGGKVWVDPTIKLSHLGRIEFEGTMITYLEKVATFNDLSKTE
jgi:hypothetical protein